MNQLKKLSVFGAALLLVAGMAGCGSEEQEVQLTAQQEKDMSERLAPAGEVVLAGNVPEPTKVASAGPRSGEDIYNSKCVACHSSGAGGAPKPVWPVTGPPVLTRVWMYSMPMPSTEYAVCRRKACVWIAPMTRLKQRWIISWRRVNNRLFNDKNRAIGAVFLWLRTLRPSASI